MNKFSQLLTSLPENESEPPREWVEKVLAALTETLVSELHRRGLWWSSPAYLGILGARHWPEGLEELALDAYTFLFVERLSALKAQLLVRDNIDGVIRRGLRHFLLERQSDNDRLGYFVFGAVRTALEVLVERGQVRVVAGETDFKNDTVLAFSSAAGQPAPASCLLELVPLWCDRLLPEMVTAHGRGRVEVAERLRQLLAELPRLGVETFRLRDLVEPLKSELRQRWRSALELEGGTEPGTQPGEGWVFPFTRKREPGAEVEERQSFKKLVACVSGKVKDHMAGERRAEDLGRLWGAVLTWIGDGARDEQPPSQRGLAELLGMSRDRVVELLKQLKGAIELCQGLLAGRVVELGARRSPA